MNVLEVAGSIRGKKPFVNDIEIVAIPKPNDIGLFESGIGTVVKQWKKQKVNYSVNKRSVSY